MDLSLYNATGFGMMGGHEKTALDYANSTLKAVYEKNGVPSADFPLYAVHNRAGKRICWLRHSTLLFNKLNAPIISVTFGEAVKQTNGYYGLEVLDIKPLRAETPTQSEGITPMKAPSIRTTIDRNTNSAKNAAYLEGGHVANTQLAAIVAKKFPALPAELIESPLGHLLIANAAVFAASSFYDNNEMVARLTQGMLTSAFQEALRSFDINSLIGELMSNPTVAAALLQAEEKEPEQE